MARYKPYNLKQDKWIPLSYADQIVPGSFEYALNEIVEQPGFGGPDPDRPGGRNRAGGVAMTAAAFANSHPQWTPSIRPVMDMSNPASCEWCQKLQIEASAGLSPQSEALRLAGSQVSTTGRFWVSTEDSHRVFLQAH
jgi:hypothetical protein